MQSNNHIVIMAGGVGSRLHPISTPEKPKQFVDLLGTGKSMIQMTMERFLPVCPPENFWVVTSAGYAAHIREQLPQIPREHILLEPAARNTAPCIAYACSKIASHHHDANIVVTPSDALITETETFTSVVSKALDFTANSGNIVTIGILPNRPETGYCYIKAGGIVRGEIVKVEQFKEKPDSETALRYLSEGNYMWNAGIFIWNVRTILAQLRTYVPQIMDVMDRIAPSFYTEKERESLDALFPACERISIDYAVLEKSPDIYMIAEDLGWSDLGSWPSLKQRLHDLGLDSRIAYWKTLYPELG